MNSRWIRDVNVNNKIIFKILKENPGEYISHISITELFSDETRGPEAIKGEGGVFDHRIKNLSMENNNICQVNNNTIKSNFYMFTAFSSLKIPIPQVAKLDNISKWRGVNEENCEIRQKNTK